LSWNTVIKEFKALQTARSDGENIEACWRNFQTAVAGCREQPPYHLLSILNALEASETAPSDIAILDQGCGTGLQVLFLLALGYTNIYGVDLGVGPTKWNRFLPLFGGPSEERFFRYDGETLPIGDSTIDILISQQVVEHVSPPVYETYYSEAGRVLRPGGIAIHQVPHRLAPYDSHTKTWGIHYLPRSVALNLYSLIGNKRSFVEERLFLRWPWRHTGMVRMHIGPCRNLTPERLAKPVSKAYYDGPRGLRSIISWVTGLPAIGPVLAFVITPLFMLETQAIRTEDR